MYSIHSHAAPYGYPAPVPARHFSAGTSSAFSASANPDEDWTKISDLAERRRIQNRIAQRNYRKKLKKRLEDLEKQAADNTSPRDAESSQIKNSRRATQGGRVQKATNGSAPSQQKQQKEATPTTATAVRLPSPTGYASPTQQDEYTFGVVYERDRSSHSPPTAYHPHYSVYPPPPGEEMMMPYAGVQASQPQFRPVPTTEAQYSDYLPATATTAPVPVTLPSLSHFNDALIKREPGGGGGGGYPGPSEQTSSLPPYGAMHGSYGGHSSYLSAVGMGHNAPSPYAEMPHVSRASPSSSSSRSPSWRSLPVTPLSSVELEPQQQQPPLSQLQPFDLPWRPFSHP